MAQRTFNWKLAIVILLALGVLAITALGLRNYRRVTLADRALAQGNEAYANERWDEAAVALGQYIARHQTDVEVLLKYADAQLRIRPRKPGSITQALASYKAVLREDSSNLKAIERISEIYLANPGSGKVGEAETLLDKFITDVPQAKPLIYYRLAQARALLSRPAEAVKTLEGLVRMHPEYVPTYAFLGSLAAQYPAEVNQPASFWFEEVVRRNPDASEARLVRASFYLSRDEVRGQVRDKAKGIADLEWAEASEPNDAETRLRLGDYWMRLGQLERAEAQFEKAAVTDGENITLWNLWARLAHKSQDPEKMKAIAERGLKALGSAGHDFYYMAVELFLAADDWEQAGIYIQKMKTGETTQPGVLFLEGRLAYLQQRYRDAATHIRRALDLGYDARAFGNQATAPWLVLADSLVRAGDLAAGVLALESSVAKYPHDLSVRLALAQGYTNQRRWDPAREQAREALLLDAENQTAALLEIQARIKALAQSGDVPDQIWSSIESRLQELGTQGAKLERLNELRLEVSMAKGELSAVETMLGQEPEEGTPAHRKWLTGKAQLANKRGDIDKMMALLERGNSLYPDDPGLALLVATMYRESGNLAASEKVLKKALEKVSNAQGKKRLVFELSDVLALKGDTNAALTLLQALKADKDKSNDIELLRKILRVAADQTVAWRQELINQIKAIEGEAGSQWRYEQARLWAQSEDWRDRYDEITAMLNANLRENPTDQSSRLLLAGLQAMAKDYQLAAVTYRDALDRSPDNLSVLIPTVQVLLENKQSTEAQSILDRILKKDPENTALLKLKLECLRQLKMFGEALPTLEKLVSLDPNDITNTGALARVYMSQQKLSQAEEIIERLRVMDPNMREASELQVEMHHRREQPQQALSLCDRLVNEYQDVRAYRLRAQTRAVLDQVDQAAADFDLAIALDPNSVGLRLEKADYLRLAGRVDASIAEMEKIYEITKDTGFAFRLVDMYFAAQAPHRAVELLKKHLPRCPEDRRLAARTLMARALHLSKEDGEADRLFRELVEGAPLDTFLVGNYMQAASQNGNWARADEIAVQWLEEKPLLPEIVSVSKLFLQPEKSALELAQNLLKRVVDRDPMHVPALSILGQTSLMLYDLDGTKDPNSADLNAALNYFRQVVSRSVGESDEKKLAINNLAWLLSEAKGEHEEAFALSSDAVVRYPDYLDLLDTHGTICLHLDKLEDAVRYLKVCVDSYPPNNPSGVGSRFNLGQVYRKMGDTAAAKAVLLEAQELNERLGGLSEEKALALKGILVELDAP